MNEILRLTDGILVNPDNPCPAERVTELASLPVSYWNFNWQEKHGVIEVHASVVDEVKQFFDLAAQLAFPIERVARSSDPEFLWDDSLLMAANVTSGFNYRLIVGTDYVSKHGLGLAFDVNPRLNPYIRYDQGLADRKIVEPEGATWDPSIPGTLHDGHPLVEYMKSAGWTWGGEWLPKSGRTDYQHFEKNCA